MYIWSQFKCCHKDHSILTGYHFAMVACMAAYLKDLQLNAF